MSTDHADSHTAARVRRLEERLIGAGLTTDEELEGILGRLISGTVLNGQRIVARAWADEGFHQRLLADATTAIAEIGLGGAIGLKPQRLIAVQNTETLHHVLVCTLCSCYPVGLLGPSPTWYKSEAYRSRVVRDPRGVLAEFGLELPADTEVVVHDTSAESRYVVVPRRPPGTGGLAEDELAALVTRDGLIGTAAL